MDDIDDIPYLTETQSEPSQASKVELFAKIVNCFEPITIFAKRSNLDIWLGSEYASVSEISTFLRKKLWRYYKFCNKKET